MSKRLQKAVAVILAVVMSSMLCVAAFASDMENQTYKITFDVQAQHMFVNIIEQGVIDGGVEENPVSYKATETYVKEGEDVTFFLTVDEGYSMVRAIVDAGGTRLEPDVHGYYTIEDVTDNVLVHVYLDADEQSSNFLSALLFFFRQIFEWIRDTFKAFKDRM